LSLVASLSEYGGTKTSKRSTEEFFEQVEQYGLISHCIERDLVAVTKSQLTDEAALFIKGLDQSDRQNLTCSRLKELLIQRFTDRLPLQYHCTVLHEARQEKTQTPTQFLDRNRAISAQKFSRVKLPANATSWQKGTTDFCRHLFMNVQDPLGGN
jgi:hypothetical protein